MGTDNSNSSLRRSQPSAETPKGTRTRASLPGSQHTVPRLHSHPLPPRASLVTLTVPMEQRLGSPRLTNHCHEPVLSTAANCSPGLLFLSSQTIG